MKAVAVSPIGVLGFSASINPVLYAEALRYLSARQLVVKAPFDPSANYGADAHLFSAASVQDRLSGFYQLLKDPDVGSIVSARGAYGSMELLEGMDYQEYARRPLLISGLSDVTALLLALYAKVPGARCVHGPSVQSGFAKAASSPAAQESSEALLALLAGNYHPAPCPLTWCAGKRAAGEVQGPLLGGNLSMVASLAGTSWLPPAHGHIVFFEEIGERPYRVHRMLLQLRLAGFFDGVKAVLLGDFLNCSHPQGLGASLAAVFEDIFRAAPFPVFSGLPVGHGDRNLPIPLGAKSRVSNDGVLSIEL